MKTVTSVNPYTGESLHSYQKHSNKEVQELLENAHEQFLKWKNTSFDTRKSYILSVVDVLEKNKKDYAKTMTLEMGKPISQSIAEIEKCIWLCEYYAQHAESQLQDIIIETDAQKSYVRHEPLGVVLAVMPWNYPFWQVFRFAIPSLMAGNVGVLKHASNVFGSALHIEKVFEEAGLPKGCFTTLLINSDGVEAVIENPLVKAVTLTGSGPAGGGGGFFSRRALKKDRIGVRRKQRPYRF